MRKIKFRGRRDDGEIFLFDATDAIEKFFAIKGVAPNKIDLFLGCDSNGDEVYEGDKLIYEEEDEEGNAIIHEAEIDSYYLNNERWTLFKKRT